mmetsp:Transcript_7133/g.17133  ORF Transcript_7133/g.17133 Transcript_7133/m.17133 type:complete len:269 (+) Transcript_7133:1014-1820(+)
MPRQRAAPSAGAPRGSLPRGASGRCGTGSLQRRRAPQGRTPPSPRRRRRCLLPRARTRRAKTRRRRRTPSKSSMPPTGAGAGASSRTMTMKRRRRWGRNMAAERELGTASEGRARAMARRGRRMPPKRLELPRAGRTATPMPMRPRPTRRTPQRPQQSRRGRSAGHQRADRAGRDPPGEPSGGIRPRRAERLATATLRSPPSPGPKEPRVLRAEMRPTAAAPGRIRTAPSRAPLPQPLQSRVMRSRRKRAPGPRSWWRGRTSTTKDER